MRRGVVAALILPPLVQGEIKTITWNYDGCSSNGSLLDYAGLVCVDCERFTGLQPDMILIGHSDDIPECKCPYRSAGLLSSVIIASPSDEILSYFYWTFKKMYRCMCIFLNLY